MGASEIEREQGVGTVERKRKGGGGESICNAGGRPRLARASDGVCGSSGGGVSTVTEQL